MSFAKGKLNSVADVKGVLVGQVESKNAKGSCSGVTAILPSKNVGMELFEAACFSLNGAGELTGAHQIKEWGLLETPIVLTNTASVGIAYETTLQWLSEKYKQVGSKWPVMIPIVGECDDSRMHNFRKFPLKSNDVKRALSRAGTKVRQGNAGGANGLVTCGFKSGAGTSSRIIPSREGRFTLATFVHSNWGRSDELRLGNSRNFRHSKLAKEVPVQEGSLVGVIATDAPLTTHELERLCKRAALGMGRVGSTARHGSGEIFLAFSTYQKVKRPNVRSTTRAALSEQTLNELFEACVSSTEESIWNAIKEAEPATSLKGVVIPAFSETI